MRSKYLFNIYLPILGLFLAAGIGATSLWRFQDFRTQEGHLRRLAQGVTSADGMSDIQKAIQAYESLSASLPEIQIRILQRQWRIAMDLIGQIQRMKFNPFLKKDVPALYDKLREHLDQMRDHCSVLLTEKDAVSNEVLWQTYNISAAARLLTAYATLETENNWPKVQGMIRESISDLKLAIETVDKLPGATSAKNIPRWNLELLYDQQYVRKLSLFNPENPNRIDLKENLETVIPEHGGYAPGEPVDRSIRK